MPVSPWIKMGAFMATAASARWKALVTAESCATMATASPRPKPAEAGVGEAVSPWARPVVGSTPGGSACETPTRCPHVAQLRLTASVTSRRGMLEELAEQ